MKRFTFITNLGEQTRKTTPEEVEKIISKCGRKRLLDDEDCHAIYDDSGALVWHW